MDWKAKQLPDCEECEERKHATPWDVVKEVVGFVLFVALCMFICNGPPKPVERWWTGAKTDTTQAEK